MKRTIQRLAVAALAALSLTAASFAQDELPTSPAFERALVVEEIEHDLRQALELYAAIAADDAAPDALRRRAWLRIGRARAALGQMDVAREALERAAAGDDAVAELARERLADPGRDEERARLLREEARTWMQVLPTSGQNHGDIDASSSGRNLLWIGRAAVPVIVRELENRRTSGDPYAWKGHQESLLFGALWRIGGAEASEYLDRVRGFEQLPPRETAVLGIHHGNALAGGTVAVAERYLRDPDPDVAISCLSVGVETLRLYDPAEIVALVDSPMTRVRVRALLTFGRHWPVLGGDMRATVDALVPRLERALRDVSPEVGQAALDCLSSVGIATGESRALLLREMAGLDPGQGFATGNRLELTPEDAGARALAELLPVLAPGDPSSWQGRDRSVATLLRVYLEEWDLARLDTVLLALQVGYHDVPLGDWIREHCGPAETDRVLAAVPAFRTPAALQSLANWLYEAPLSPTAWPHLAEIEDWLAERDPDFDWSGRPQTWSPLYQAMGRCGHPAAIARLAELAKQSSNELRYGALVAAVRGALIVAGEPAFAPARALLLAETPDVDRTRQLLFADMVRAGDPRAFELLPRATELGMRNTQYYPPGAMEADAFRTEWGYGAAWLALYRANESGVEWFHGYADATWAALWDELLAAPRGPEWNTSWRLLGSALTGTWNKTETVAGRSVPQAYRAPAPRLVEVAARRWAARAAVETGNPDDDTEQGLVSLLDIGRRRAVEEAAALEAVREMHDACLDSPSADLRRVAVQLLPDEMDEAQRAALLDALGDPDPWVAEYALRRVLASRQAVPPEVLRRLLENPSDSVRESAIVKAAPLVDGGATELVSPALDDPAVGVRVAACRYLGTQVDADAVPELLQRLTDLDANVREAAAEALRAIRFYHDEKAHWDRVFAGTELSAAGAAEALLRQAAAGEPREQRLLAIRSLGSLGAPETLPFLIEWTGAEDPELATAARDAIARIHAR